VGNVRIFIRILHVVQSADPHFTRSWVSGSMELSVIPVCQYVVYTDRCRFRTFAFYNFPYSSPVICKLAYVVVITNYYYCRGFLLCNV